MTDYRRSAPRDPRYRDNPNREAEEVRDESEENDEFEDEDREDEEEDDGDLGRSVVDRER